MSDSLTARARRRRILLRVVAALMPALTANAVHAEPACPAAAKESRVGIRWPTPLDRLVTLHARDVALGDALERLSVAARLRISYSPELLALERRLCISYDSVAAGAVLSEILSGSAVSPVVAGDDQVVLAPVAATRKAEQRVERGVNVLDRVVVTGAPIGVSQRGLSTFVDVVDRSELARQGGSALSQTLNGIVPGLWLWEHAPSNMFARYGSVRGASSFEVSYPKVYIDGIEVANPLVLTELSANAVERVEVIRGPQGAALYGADAMAGVINIVMRHDNGDGTELAQIRSTAGVAHSAFAQRPTLVQEHSLSFRGGSDVRSSSLSLSFGSTGSYVPGAQSRELRGDGGFRIVGTRSMLTGTARLFAKDAGTGTSPFLSGTPVVPEMQNGGAGHDQWRAGGHDYQARPVGDAASNDQSLRQYTLGSTATFISSERWTHEVTAGIDGYRLFGGASPLLTPNDSALRAAWGGADRATLRASSVARMGNATAAAATMTLAADYSALEQTASADAAYPLGTRSRDYSGWQTSGGVVGQVDASWRNGLFATAGLRVERDGGLAATTGLVALPMIGGAAVRELGVLTTKLRASYGKGIRPVASVVRSSWSARHAVVQGTLAPEQQSGIEAGVDAFVGRAFAVHVTRFDQHAYDLIQPVATTSTLLPYPDENTNRLVYALQNLGEISNRGWELESSLARGALSLTGTLSLVDSRVQRLAAGYSGDLRTGDRMLGVPARTAGLTSAWTTPRWSTSLTVTRASNWVNYDGLALTSASQPATGADLRSYWRSYSGVTRVDASFTRQLTRGVSLVSSGHNLLDVQRGEPDNITVVPGRTIIAGLQAKF
jgi:outer membrane cobalamin receptor